MLVKFTQHDFLFNIKDDNITILSNKIENKVIKGILTYNPDYCPCCGAINEYSNDIIKWGFRKYCIIKIPIISNCKSRLILHKQRFYCKNCNNTFIAETNLVDIYINISNNTELQIVEELMIKQSEKDISKRLDVSISKNNRKLTDISSHSVLRHYTLPKSKLQKTPKAKWLLSSFTMIMVISLTFKILESLVINLTPLNGKDLLALIT